MNGGSVDFDLLRDLAEEYIGERVLIRVPDRVPGDRQWCATYKWFRGMGWVIFIDRRTFLDLERGPLAFLHEVRHISAHARKPRIPEDVGPPHQAVTDLPSAEDQAVREAFHHAWEKDADRWAQEQLVILDEIARGSGSDSFWHRVLRLDGEADEDGNGDS